MCIRDSHDPVPFMGSPVEMSQVNREEVSPELDAILSVDTTKGNRVINTRGFAISPTVKEGYILRTSEDLLDLMQILSLIHIYGTAKCKGMAERTSSDNHNRLCYPE